MERNMLVFMLFGFAVAAGLSQTPQPGPTTTTSAPIRCGVIPNSIYQCMGNPKIIKPEVSSQCNRGSISECERIKCIFRKSKWLLTGGHVNTQKMSEYFDGYAKEHPEWGPAVQVVKNACLGAALPPQGVYVNCPQYDVLMCAVSAFVKNVPASQWSTAPECGYPRQFAASCPLCPEDCFATSIPVGSCQACILLPRSP